MVRVGPPYRVVVEPTRAVVRVVLTCVCSPTVLRLRSQAYRPGPDVDTMTDRPLVSIAATEYICRSDVS
jgi:hypothetical protein